MFWRKLSVDKFVDVVDEVRWKLVMSTVARNVEGREEENEIA